MISRRSFLKRSAIGAAALTPLGRFLKTFSPATYIGGDGSPVEFYSDGGYFIPSGFLPLDGRILSADDYQELYITLRRGK